MTDSTAALTLVPTLRPRAVRRVQKWAFAAGRWDLYNNAEDVVQEALIRLISSPIPADPVLQSVYLSRLVRLAWADHVKFHARQRRDHYNRTLSLNKLSECDDEFDVEDDSLADPTDRVMAAELALAVLDEIHKLTPHQRGSLKLRGKEKATLRMNARRKIRRGLAQKGWLVA